ncbi:MAG TPA: hypothetical protein PK910_09280 [Bacteroidales bacterium]|nr:hypothetical protein [Bacteroidales bacterium]HRC90194.1 hypothetical protein [Bacteroidales bacterium]
MAICVSGSILNFSYNFNLSTGNLVWRQNNKYPGLKEDFQYDNLERLDNINYLYGWRYV